MDSQMNKQMANNKLQPIHSNIYQNNTIAVCEICTNCLIKKIYKRNGHHICSTVITAKPQLTQLIDPACLAH